MNSKRDFLMDAFLNLIWLSVFYGIFIMPAVVILNLRVDILFLASFIMSLVYFFIRRYIRLVFPMIIAHIIVPVVVFNLAFGFAQALYVGVAVFLMIFSFQQRHTRSATFGVGFSYAASIVLIAFALFVNAHGYDLLFIYAVLMIFVSVGSKLHTRMVQVNDSLEVITQTSTQPVKKILAFDYKATLVFCIVIVGLIVFLHVFFIRPALEAASEIRINMQLGPLPPHADLDEANGDTSYTPGGIDFSDIELRDPWLIWVILERMLMTMVPPIIILGVAYLLFRLAREVLRHMKGRNIQEHEHASGFEDVKEFISAPKARRPWFFAHRGEHKLRRLFRETMTRHIKKGVPIKKTDTPVQMAKKVQAEDLSGLVEEYTAVRYGKS